MELRFQDWFANALGFQSVVEQFGAQQNQLQNHEVGSASCDGFIAPTPPGFETASLVLVRDNLAAIPFDWDNSGIGRSWLKVAGHTSVLECVAKIASADFIAFDRDFLKFVGPTAQLEKIYAFSGIDADHVHEAPVYVAETNELVFADTFVVGWLWALHVETHQIRKINTSPPLENVNGGTRRGSQIYLTTNGGSAPAVWNCTLPTGDLSNSSTETINCEIIVNNYRFAHLNSPNDLIFTSSGNILFTDPTYGWAQSWPGIGPPELPTATYLFNTKTRALIALDNDQVLQPNGLALSIDEKTLYVADSNSTSGKPIGVWEDSVRNVYAFDFDEKSLTLKNRRLAYVGERGWPDGLRVAKMKDGRELLLVATMGGVDIVDVSRKGAGILLGKWNVNDDIIFNLEPVGNRESGIWLLTGRKGVYKVSIASTR